MKDNIVNLLLMNGLIIFKKIDLFNIYLLICIYLLMSELFINNQNTNDLDNCDYLSIIKLTISKANNINLLLDKLYKFTNLQILDLSNKITEIKGLDNLVNLQELHLYSNKITEIKRLNNLINLQGLYLHDNQITEIKDLIN